MFIGQGFEDCCRVSYIHIAPDDQTLFHCYDQSLFRYNLLSGKSERVIEEGYSVNQALSVNGYITVTTGWNDSIQIWDFRRLENPFPQTEQTAPRESDDEVEDFEIG